MHDVTRAIDKQNGENVLNGISTSHKRDRHNAILVDFIIKRLRSGFGITVILHKDAQISSTHFVSSWQLFYSNLVCCSDISQQKGNV